MLAYWIVLLIAIYVLACWYSYSLGRLHGLAAGLREANDDMRRHRQLVADR